MGVLPKVTHSKLGTSIQRCVNSPEAVQGVASTLTGDWWLVRAYPVGSDHLWLQWNGPKEYLEDPVLAVFESFSPRS